MRSIFLYQTLIAFLSLFLNQEAAFPQSGQRAAGKDPETDSTEIWKHKLSLARHDSDLYIIYSGLIRSELSAGRAAQASNYMLDALERVKSPLLLYHSEDFIKATFPLISEHILINDSVTRERIRTFPKNGDKRNLVKYYAHLASNYLYLEAQNTAMEFAIKAEQIALSMNDPVILAEAALPMFHLYAARHNYDQAFRTLKTLESAEYGDQMKVRHWIYRYGRMIIYSEKMNFDSLYHYSTMYPDSIPTLYHQAYCYYMTGYALANMNLHEESARYMSLAKNLNRQLNNHVEYYRYLTQWASILLKTGKFSEAIDSLEYRLDEIRQTDKNMSYVETLKTLADAYKGQNRPREALEYLVRYSDAKDSAATEKSARKILEMQSRYEIEKKDTEIAQQAVLIRKQKVTNYVIGGCAAMFLVLGGVVFFGNRGRHRANAELAAARDHAERSEQFKRQFLANMSHEIRTPMNAVTGMIRLLIEKNPRGDQTAYLDAMRQSADSLLHIINDILDFSKMEAGKVSLEQIDFPVTDLMGQVENTLRLAADAKGIAFDVVTDPFIPPVVIGDPVRIAQILINLANNAIKFTPSGTVTVSAKRERGDVVSFAVEDTGIGIEPEKLESVFERFTQANASDTREYGGTGLGLSISRQLVSLMGGKLEVNSQLGKGTRFFFSLVLPEGDTQNRSTSLASKASASRIPDGIKILLVDDNEDNRLVARDTLESKAHVEIHEAVNGEEAVKKIMEADFDLVLMDVQMPVMDGYEATRRIRKLPSPKCNIPIIALTASVIRSDLEKCSESGMEDYVPKPFTTEQLLSAILRNILPKEAGSNLNPSASK